MQIASRRRLILYIRAWWFRTRIPWVGRQPPKRFSLKLIPHVLTPWAQNSKCERASAALLQSGGNLANLSTRMRCSSIAAHRSRCLLHIHSLWWWCSAVWSQNAASEIWSTRFSHAHSTSRMTRCQQTMCHCHRHYRSTSHALLCNKENPETCNYYMSMLKAWLLCLFLQLWHMIGWR